MAKEKKLEFRELNGNDAEEFIGVRLEGLRAHPEFFVSSYEVERKLKKSDWQKRLEENSYFGCFKGGRLLGVVGYVGFSEKKMEHTARLGAFYIKPEYRGRGFARKLFRMALDKASKNFEKVMLVVNAKNKSAIRVYKATGFTQYAYDKKALKINGKYYDEIHMVQFF